MILEKVWYSWAKIKKIRIWKKEKINPVFQQRQFAVLVIKWLLKHKKVFKNKKRQNAKIKDEKGNKKNYSTICKLHIELFNFLGTNIWHLFCFEKKKGTSISCSFFISYRKVAQKRNCFFPLYCVYLPYTTLCCRGLDQTEKLIEKKNPRKSWKDKRRNCHVVNKQKLIMLLSLGWFFLCFQFANIVIFQAFFVFNP